MRAVITEKTAATIMVVPATVEVAGEAGSAGETAVAGVTVEGAVEATVVEAVTSRVRLR